MWVTLCNLRKDNWAVILSPHSRLYISQSHQWCQFTFLTVGIFKITCQFFSVGRNMLHRSVTKIYRHISPGSSFFLPKHLYKLLCHGWRPKCILAILKSWNDNSKLTRSDQDKCIITGELLYLTSDTLSWLLPANQCWKIEITRNAKWYRPCQWCASAFPHVF